MIEDEFVEAFKTRFSHTRHVFLPVWRCLLELFENQALDPILYSEIANLVRDKRRRGNSVCEVLDYITFKGDANLSERIEVVFKILGKSRWFWRKLFGLSPSDFSRVQRYEATYVLLFYFSPVLEDDKGFVSQILEMYTALL